MPTTMSRRAMTGALATFATVVTASCSTRVTSTGTGASAAPPLAGLPPPDAVYVSPFTVQPSAVQLDTGVSARLLRNVNGAPTAEQQYTTAEQVQSGISNALAKALQPTHLSIVQGTMPAELPGPGVVVRGQITRIDEGNRTRRNLVGLGAGQSDVTADVQLYYVRPGAPPVLLQSFTASSNSGRTPGLGIGVASTAATGSVATAGALAGTRAATSTGVAGEGQKLGRHLATEIGKVFENQGWISAADVPPATLR